MAGLGRQLRLWLLEVNIIFLIGHNDPPKRHTYRNLALPSHYALSLSAQSFVKPPLRGKFCLTPHRLRLKLDIKRLGAGRPCLVTN